MINKMRKELLPICAMVAFIASFIGAAQAQTYYFYQSLPGLLLNSDDCSPFCTVANQDLDIDIISIDYLTMSVVEENVQIDVDIISSTITDFSALELEIITDSGQSIIDVPIKSGNDDTWSLDISRDLADPEGDTDITLKFSMNGAEKTKDISIAVYACNDSDPLTGFVKNGNYHIISSPAQLLCLSHNQTNDVLSADYRLGVYIDFAAYSLVDWDGNGSADGSGTSGWIPLGSYASAELNAPYTGTFDGDGYSIENLYISRSGGSYQGLFGYTNGASIKDVDIDATISAYSAVGILAGRLDATTVEDVFISGSSIASYTYVGGAIGLAGTVSTISRTGSSAFVQGGAHYTGGLLGLLGTDGVVEDSYATGQVIATNWYGGGLIGASWGGHVRRSYATGNVSANNYYAGGLVAAMVSTASITDCYATGNVTGGNYNGGLVGYIRQDGGTITNSYSKSIVSGSSNSGGLVGNIELPAYDETASITQNYAINGTYTALYSRSPNIYDYCSDDYDSNCHATEYKMGNTKEFWDDSIWRNLEDADPELEWQYPSDTYDSTITVGGPI